MIRVCSGMHPAGYDQYGRKFLDTFDRHWDRAIDLKVWTERRYDMPRDACRSLWDIPGAAEIQERYHASAERCGRVPRLGWKESARRAGYNFRFDASKFWKQILIPEAASLDMADGDILIWLDADVVSLAPVAPEWINELLGEAEVCYLGRDRSHSEIGFWAVRLNPRTRYFLWGIANCYRTDAVFDLKEWHSAFVWDSIRRDLNLAERDLTLGQRGHVFARSPLSARLDHLKGDHRKRLGFSVERRR